MNRHLPPVAACVPLCLSGLLLSFSAAAADGNGWYAGGKIGLDIPKSQSFNSPGGGFTNDYDTGFAGGINGGYAFANGLRPELEVDYHHTSVNQVTVVSTQEGSTEPSGSVTGSMSAITVMGNLWYDFKRPDGILSVVYPYAGAGIGMANFGLHDEKYRAFSGDAGSADGSATAFAYQLGFGVDYDILATLAASIDFRYLMTTSLSLSGQSGGSGGISGEYRQPSLFAGLKYKFGGSD